MGALKRWAACFPWFWLLLPAGLLVAHALLWPQGVWKDEYFTFGILHVFGWPAMVQRLLHWSPRPVSEALLYGVLRAIERFHSPLVMPSLALAWGIWLGAMAAVIQPWRGPGRLARLALLLGLPAACLLAGPVNELYYWPIGSLAYLPALAAAAAASLLVAGPGIADRRGQWGVFAAMLAGAGSVELGGVLTLCAAPLLALAAWQDQRPQRAGRITLAVAPGVAAGALMALAVAGRTAPTLTNLMGGASYHRGWSSLVAALPAFLPIGLPIGLPSVIKAVNDDGSGGPPPWQLLLMKALFFAAAHVALGQAWPNRPARAPMAAMLLAVAATFYLSVAGALYQFGGLCCERHEAYRQALVLLMLVLLAGLVRPARARRVSPQLAPALTAAALIWAAPVRLQNIAAEMRLAPARRAAWAEIFASGQASGDGLHFVIPPAGPLLTYDYIPAGHYVLAARPAWFIQGPMIFFGKTQMLVERARP